MREIQVYNTMTRRKEVFVPARPGEASIYVCGVTPYNEPHIGNARPFVTWDVIRRYLAKAGYRVRYVQNFTDVDDKIIRTANETHRTWKDVADKYIAAYFHAMDALNVKRADVYPRVSETIPEIVEMVARLVADGYAYELDGDVYYSVESFSRYGCLSGRSLDDMMAGARVEVDERKHNPMDFALWKSAKPGEPWWDSPWGHGRPGWHIECSAMSLKYLGKTFDFHGGGSDLVFPHHENEIAQSQAYCGGDCNSFARCWVHNGFVTIKSEKMSKSLGNFFTVNEILQKYPGEVVRFFILQTHYRSPLDFSDERLQDAQAALARLQATKRLLAEHGVAASTALRAEAEQLRAQFDDALADDFNTGLATAALFTLAKAINRASLPLGQQAARDCTADVAAIFDEMCATLGILEQPLDDKAEGNGVDDEVARLVDERLAARKAKNWKRADEIRGLLKARGITLEDTASGTRVVKA